MSDILSHGERVISGEALSPWRLSRRAVFLWSAAIIFANYLAWTLKVASATSFAALPAEIAAAGVLQYLAWYVVFDRLLEADSSERAGTADVIAALLFPLLLLLPSSRMVWVAATLLGGYALIAHRRDRFLCAASVVLLALSAQQLWAHMIFNAIALTLLRVETAVVGTLLQATQHGIEWHGNVITAPSGYGIAIFSACSSFHNVSLALLCWVTLTKWRRPLWKKSDIATAAVVSGTMILLNVVRLYLMALGEDYYHFWHDAAGAEIFPVVALAVVFGLSYYGTSSASSQP